MNKDRRAAEEEAHDALVAELFDFEERPSSVSAPASPPDRRWSSFCGGWRIGTHEKLREEGEQWRCRWCFQLLDPPHTKEKRMAGKRTTTKEPMSSMGDIMLKIQEEQGTQLKGELEESVRDLVARVKDTKVTDAGSYAQADQDCKTLKERRDAIEAKLAPYIDAANRIHKFFTSLRGAIFLQLDPHIDRLRREMGSWKTAEDTRKREQERQLAFQAQEEERQRLADEAQLRRAQGDEAGAQVAEVQAQTAPAPAVVLPSTVPVLEGTSFATYYRWRPIGGDTPENRKRLAQTIVPRDALMLDDKWLNSYAERMKGTGRVPGIEFYSEELPTQRRRSA